MTAVVAAAVGDDVAAEASREHLCCCQANWTEPEIQMHSKPR